MLIVRIVIAGLGVGAGYGFMAVGFSVIFSGTGVFNLAQGDLLTIGTLITFALLSTQLWGALPTLAVVIVVVLAVALIEERVVIRPFLNRRMSEAESQHELGWLVATIGFSLFLEGVYDLVYGNRPLGFVADNVSPNFVHIGAAAFRVQYLLVLAALLVATAAVALFYRRTALGKAMRATSEDRLAATLRGIRPERVSRSAFALGGILAAIGGFVVAPITLANTSLATEYTLKGFIAIAIGGFGSLRGAVMGALLLGVTEQFFDVYVSATYEDLAGVLLLTVVLLIRPRGLFGSVSERMV